MKIKFGKNELEHIPKISVYNHNFYKIKQNDTTDFYINANEELILRVDSNEDGYLELSLGMFRDNKFKEILSWGQIEDLGE